MSVEFRNVHAGPLVAFSAIAPAGAIIGVIGESDSGVSELLKIAGGLAQPEQGEILGPAERRLVAVGDALNLAPAAVLALDHALAIQDALVRARTLIGIDRLRRVGATVFLSSHEERLLESVCDEVWWLDAGRLAAKGDPRETLDRYRRAISERLRSWGDTIPLRLTPIFRRGNGHAEVISIETLGASGQPSIVWKSGEMVSVRATVRFHEAIAEPVLGMLIRTQIGFEVYGTNTEIEHLGFGPRAAGDTVTVVFSFLCDLCPHAYTFTLASHDPDGTAHDWLDDAVAFTVTSERPVTGVADLRARVTIEK